MTSVTTTPTARFSLGHPSTVRTALALGRAEGRRLLRHPAYLAGMALSFVFLFVVSEVVGTTPDVPFILWVGLGVYPLAAGTFLASFTATVRSRRHATDDLFGTAQSSAAARTGAHLVAVAWGVAGSAALLAAAGIRHEIWDGVLVPMVDGVVPVVPHPVELALGPLIVLFFGVLAVAVARWVPSLLALPVAVVVLLVHFVTGSWGLGGTFRWFLPLAGHQVDAGWVQVGPNSGYSIVASFDRVALAWHDGYLVALTIVVAVAALLRHGLSRGRAAWLAGGLAAAGLMGALQLP